MIDDRPLTAAEELEQNRGLLAAVEQLLPRLEREHELAQQAQARFDAALARIEQERGRALAPYPDARTVETNGHLEIAAGRKAVPLEVRRKVAQLASERRTLEAEREAWLKAGGRTASAAWSQLNQATIDAAVLRARVAELGGR